MLLLFSYLPRLFGELFALLIGACCSSSCLENCLHCILVHVAVVLISSSSVLSTSCTVYYCMLTTNLYNQKNHGSHVSFKYNINSLSVELNSWNTRNSSMARFVICTLALHINVLSIVFQVNMVPWYWGLELHLNISSSDIILFYILTCSPWNPCVVNWASSKARQPSSPEKSKSKYKYFNLAINSVFTKPIQHIYISHIMVSWLIYWWLNRG